MRRTLPGIIAPLALIAATTSLACDRAETTAPEPAALAADVAATSPSSCGPGQRGRLIGFEKVASRATPADVQAYFDEWIAFYQDFYRFPAVPVTFDHGFDSYRVTYCTVDAALPGQATGRPTAATGMLSVPLAPGPLSTVVYLHGTSVSFYDAVSNPDIAGAFNPGGESFDGPPSNAIFAGAGFIYVGPDYLGLGGSAVPRHRYFHAATEASSAVDLLAAAREVLATLQVQQTDELFTFGFSQGGHSALALHRELEAASVRVTGTATVGGVFDVEQWFLSSLANKTTRTLPLYLSYILLAYDDVYGVLGNPSDVFKRPYDSRVEDLFDMQHFFDDVVAGLAPNGRALIEPHFYGRILASPQEPLRVRLRENAVDRWTPLASVRVYHSPDDEEVPFEDALVSVDRLRGMGGDVTVETLPGFDHVNSWIQAMPRAVAWFRSLE